MGRFWSSRREYDYRLGTARDPNRASPVRVERPYIKDRLYVIDFTGGWSWRTTVIRFVLFF